MQKLERPQTVRSPAVAATREQEPRAHALTRREYNF